LQGELAVAEEVVLGFEMKWDGLGEPCASLASPNALGWWVVGPCGVVGPSSYWSGRTGVVRTCGGSHNVVEGLEAHNEACVVNACSCVKTHMLQSCDLFSFSQGGRHAGRGHV
jgi:hypothetical protein